MLTPDRVIYTYNVDWKKVYTKMVLSKKSVNWLIKPKECDYPEGRNSIRLCLTADV